MYETRSYPNTYSRLMRTSAPEVRGFVVDSARLSDGDIRRLLRRSVWANNPNHFKLRLGPQRVSRGEARAVALGNTFFLNIAHSGDTWQKPTDFSRSITLEHPLAYIIDDCSMKCEWQFSQLGVIRRIDCPGARRNMKAARQADGVIAEYYYDARVLRLCKFLYGNHGNVHDMTQTDEANELSELASEYVTRLQAIRRAHHCA